MEDYTVVYLGAALFKILRLLLVGAFSVHFFACIFFRVKVATAVHPEDVILFYSSRNVEEHVRNGSLCWATFIFKLTVLWFCFFVQDLMNQYVRMSQKSLRWYQLQMTINLKLIHVICCAVSLFLLRAYNFHNGRIWYAFIEGIQMFLYFVNFGMFDQAILLPLRKGKG